MTLVISSIVPEGVVVTADSRQTYVNRSNFPRIASDNASKIIQLSDTAVVATSGLGFFADGGKLKSIQSYLNEFRDAHQLAGLTILEISQALDAFCREWLERIIRISITLKVAAANGSNLSFLPIANGKLPYEFDDAQGLRQREDWNLALVSFIVAGRNPDNICHSISIAPFLNDTIHLTSDAPNLHWIGQTEVINKLLTGQNPFVISSATMTVQDAVDFSILLTQTTENIQKFSDGMVGFQGGVPGVGGPIDVVFVPRKGELKWLSQKTLHTKS